MEKSAKTVVRIYAAAAALSQLLFAFVFLAMRDAYIAAPRLRRPTEEELRWAAAHPGRHSALLKDGCHMLGGILLCIAAAGIVHLLVQRDSVLPIRGRWKLLMPLGGFLTGALCCQMVVRRAVHLRMYAEFLPLEFTSLVLIGLLAAGLLARRRHELRR